MTNTRMHQEQEQYLIDGYDAVLARVMEAKSMIDELKPSVTLIFERNKIKQAISQLDDCAEQLGKLDQDLSNITRLEGNLSERLHSMSVFSGLLDKGNATCVSLYQAYRLLHELEDRNNLYLILIAVMATLVCALFFLV